MHAFSATYALRIQRRLFVAQRRTTFCKWERKQVSGAFPLAAVAGQLEWEVVYRHLFSSTPKVGECRLARDAPRADAQPFRLSRRSRNLF